MSKSWYGTFRFGSRKERFTFSRLNLDVMRANRQTAEVLDPYNLLMEPIDSWHGEDLWERSSLPADTPPMSGCRVYDAETREFLGLVVRCPRCMPYTLHARYAYSNTTKDFPTAIDEDARRGMWLAIGTDANAGEQWREMSEALGEMLRILARPHRALPPPPGAQPDGDDIAALQGFGNVPPPPMTPEDLAAAGRLLSGDKEEWKRPLARALGPLHPDGPRDTLDPRGVDRWSSGAREIPDWVGPALRGLLVGLAEDLERDAAAARAVASRL